MPHDITPARSRRTLLGAGLVATVLVTTVASIFTRPGAAQATHTDVHLGVANAAATTTKITVSAAVTAIEGESATGIGVRGKSTSGYGLYGDTSSGIAIYGSSSTGIGLWASSGTGAAIHASSGGGYALETIGRLRLTDVSGVAVIPAGSTSVTVDIATDVTAGSFALIAPRANIGGRALWSTIDTAADTLKIRLSASRAKDTKVSWLLLD